MSYKRLEYTWAGQVTFAAGQQSVTKWVVPTGPGTLGTVTSAPTSFDSLFKIDTKGFEYCAMAVWAKKVAHAESVSFSARYVHAEAAPDGDYLPAQGPLFESGYQLPYINSAGGTAVMAQYSWRAAAGNFQGEGGLVNAQVLNAVNSGWVYFYGQPAGIYVSVKPCRLVVACTAYTAGATVLTGTNTWDYKLMLVAY